MKNTLIILIILLLQIGCKKNNKFDKENISIQSIENTNVLKPHKKVIIHGTSDDPKALQYFNLINNSYLFGTDHKFLTKNISTDSIYIKLDSINKSQLLEVWAFGDTLHYTRVFVTPGDTLQFKIKNQKLQFIGKNAAYNNFYSALENEKLMYRNNPYKGNIDMYKEGVKAIYNKNISFFEQYINENNIHNIEYITLIKDDLKFEYLNNLIQPRSVLVKSMGWYVQGQDGVLSVIDDEYKNKENLFDYRNYIDNVTIEAFKKPDLLNHSWAFKNSFDSFIRFYFVKDDHLKYTQKSFLAEKEFIQKNFDGELENYAIARMIREYHMNGFGYSEINLALIKGLIKEYEDKFTKPSYKEKMNEFMEELNNFNFTLSNYALQSKLINPAGDTTNLGEVFQRTKQKIKVIDFWASWCPPCIREIKKVKGFKNELKDKNHVEWIYISIDKDFDKWMKKTLELQEYFNVENQYYLQGGINSSLAKSLKVRGIPRYVIFDKKEKIILDNAPRPSDTIVFKRVIDDINLKE